MIMGLMAYFLCSIFMVHIFLLTSGVKSKPIGRTDYSTEQVKVGFNQTQTNGTHSSIKEVDNINNTTAASITSEKSTEKLDLPLSPDKIKHEIDLFVKEMSNANSFENSKTTADPNIASMDNKSKQDMSQEKLDQEIDLFLKDLKDYYDEKNATSTSITKGKIDLDVPMSTESVKHETDQFTGDMNEENKSKQDMSREKLDQETELFLKDLKDYHDEKNAASATTTKDKIDLGLPMSTESLKHEIDQFIEDMNNNHKDTPTATTTTSSTTNLINEQILTRTTSSSISHTEAHKSASLGSESQAHETAVKKVNVENDVTWALVTGACASSLLITLLLVVMFLVLCYRKSSCSLWKGKKDLSLNKDCNRWDPQLLRPSKKNIDAFIFGTPIPSVSEMIKQ